MKQRKEEATPWFYVKKKSLLGIAGSVWLIAGFNVARLGVLAYAETGLFRVWSVTLSLLVFLLFGMMFYKMVGKHTTRILGDTTATKPLWTFFDAKAYCIMIFMMSGGIWLRFSGLVPMHFIAVFYTGLGLALALAGVLFWWSYLKRKQK